MTVVHIIPFLWSGAGRVVTRLCVEQARHHAVHIVTTGAAHGSRDWPAYRRQLRAAGVQHHRIDTYDRSAPAFWTAVTRLTSILDAVTPAVLHTHAGVPAAVGAIARDRCRATRPRLVAHMYSWGPDRPAWMDDADLWGFSRADAVICSARHYGALLEQGGVSRRRIHYIPWGVDVPVRSPAVQAEAGLIGFAGRVEPRKNQLVLAQAVRGLRRRSGLRLELVGPVADTAYASRITAALKATPRSIVHLRGRVRDVAPVMARWSLFVSLSQDEGQGLAILEAMASGVPVAGYRVAGVEDYLEDGETGVVITPGTPAQIGRQLEAALSNPEALARMTRNARALVQARYTWDVTLSRIGALYRRVKPPISSTKRDQVKYSR